LNWLIGIPVSLLLFAALSGALGSLIAVIGTCLLNMPRALFGHGITYEHNNSMQSELMTDLGE
jgi:hypothetical protein